MRATGKWLLHLQPWEQQTRRNPGPLIFASRAAAHLPQVSGRADKRVKLGGADKAFSHGSALVLDLDV